MIVFISYEMNENLAKSFSFGVEVHKQPMHFTNKSTSNVISNVYGEIKMQLKID